MHRKYVQASRSGPASPHERVAQGVAYPLMQSAPRPIVGWDRGCVIGPQMTLGGLRQIDGRAPDRIRLRQSRSSVLR